MKRILYMLTLLVACLTVSAQKKVDTMDDNKWKWLEYSDKNQSVYFENGYLNVENKKINYLAKTFVKLPLLPKEDYKLTIKIIVPTFMNAWYTFLFNLTDKGLHDEEGNRQLANHELWVMAGKNWMLNINDGQKHKGKLHLKGKKGKNYPMEIVLEKRHDTATISINGIIVFDGGCTITEPYIGFAVPYFPLKKDNYIQIDELIIEQAEPVED